MSARVAVLGAGIAGLSAATELRRNGYDVAVYEATGRVAGLASSHHDEDGFSYDALPASRHLTTTKTVSPTT